MIFHLGALGGININFYQGFLVLYHCQRLLAMTLKRSHVHRRRANLEAMRIGVSGQTSLSICRL